MKKLLTTLAVALVAAASLHAATLNWGVSGEFFDSANGYDYEGVLYAATGAVDLMLVIGTVTSIGWDADNSVWLDQDQNVLSPILTGVTGPRADSHGNYTQVDTVNKATFGVTGQWDDINAVPLTLITISGDYYGLYSGNTVGFSEASGENSIGYFQVGTMDAAGAGQYEVIPEPATAGLLALGLAALALRRRRVA